MTEPSPRRSPRYWRTAAIAALCAAAGSPVWGALFLHQGPSEKTWLVWAAEVAFGGLLGWFLFEPLLHHLQAGRVPAVPRARARAFKTCVQGIGAVAAAVLAEAYKDGIIKSLDSFGEWGGTCLILGLVTYAWLRAPAAPHREASERAEWYAVLGVLGFSLIAVAILAYRVFHDAERFDPTAIDQVFYATVFRTVLWSVIARLGVRVLLQPRPPALLSRLLLAALVAGALLEAGVALGLLVDSSLAHRALGATPAKALLVYPFITAGWCFGLWVATPRDLGRIAELPATPAPRISHRARLGLLYAAVLLVALATRFAFPPRPPASLEATPSYDSPRIAFFVSTESAPDPYGLYNLLSPAFPGQAATTRYVHALITVSHAPRMRPGPVEVSCRLTGDADAGPGAVSRRRIEVPDQMARSHGRGQTSWVMPFGGPDYRWRAGSYKVACVHSRGTVGGDFALR
ncbi:MAG TPA: hypothetical protein VIA61_09110 [Methylomirabilota bacterium]